MNQMIDHWVTYLPNGNLTLSEDTARERMSTIIMGLKRWSL